VNGLLDLFTCVLDVVARAFDLHGGLLGSFSNRLEPIFCLVGRLGDVLGERLDLLCDDGEPFVVAAARGSGGLDVGVQRQHVGLAGDLRNRVDEFVDLLDFLLESADLSDGAARFALDLVHRSDRCLCGFLAVSAGVDGPFGDVGHFVRGGGDLFGRRREPAHLLVDRL